MALALLQIQMLPGVSVVQADVFDHSRLSALIREHDAVVNLIAILHGSAKAFDRIHVQWVRQLAQACVDAGVRRLIHVSALGASEQAPSLYQRSKARGEAVLQSFIEQGQLAVTILRPSVIFGDDDAFINLFAKLQTYFPVMPLAGAATRFQPVWVGDVAKAIGLCLQQKSTRSQIYEACGPEVLTLKELVRIAGRFKGCERKVMALPYALGYLQALLLECLPGKTLMSRDNLASMQVDNVSAQAQGLMALGVTPRKRIREVFAPSMHR
jgi:NADH dehydrogenase